MTRFGVANRSNTFALRGVSGDRTPSRSLCLSAYFAYAYGVRTYFSVPALPWPPSSSSPPGSERLVFLFQNLASPLSRNSRCNRIIIPIRVRDDTPASELSSHVDLLSLRSAVSAAAASRSPPLRRRLHPSRLLDLRSDASARAFASRPPLQPRVRRLNASARSPSASLRTVRLPPRRARVVPNDFARPRRVCRTDCASLDSSSWRSLSRRPGRDVARPRARIRARTSSSVVHVAVVVDAVRRAGVGERRRAPREHSAKEKRFRFGSFGRSAVDDARR